LAKMMKTKRFTLITDVIDIKKLERESRKFLYLGFVIAVLLHSGLAAYFTLRKPLLEEVQYIPVKLFVRRPEFTRPLAVSEKVAQKKYTFRKKTVPGKPSGEIVTKRLSKLEIPDYEYRWEIDHEVEDNFDMLADSLLTHEMISILPKDIIPLKNQVFFDIGINKSMIITYPENKMAIQGYTHIAIGRSEQLKPPDFLRTAVHNLAYALGYFTNIYATSDRSIYFHYPPGTEEIINKNPLSEANYRIKNKSPDEILKYPFIYITTDKSFELTEEEKQNLRQYLRSGGFVILDNGVPEYGFSRAGESLKQMIIDAISSVKLYCGNPPKIFIVNDYSFKPLPKYHSIYHCFFDFNNGVPPGYCDVNSKSYIEGIYMDSRLVGIYTSQGYGRAWHDPKNVEQLKLGVNMVVYAVTRPKGIYRANCQKGKSSWEITDAGSVKAW